MPKHIPTGWNTKNENLHREFVTNSTFIVYLLYGCVGVSKFVAGCIIILTTYVQLQKSSINLMNQNTFKIIKMKFYMQYKPFT